VHARAAAVLVASVEFWGSERQLPRGIEGWHDCEGGAFGERNGELHAATKVRCESHEESSRCEIPFPSLPTGKFEQKPSGGPYATLVGWCHALSTICDEDRVLMMDDKCPKNREEDRAD
jgi:hypothetical protein